MFVTTEEARTKECRMPGTKGRCISDACMGWRTEVFVDGHFQKSLKGYCGHAGKPEKNTAWPEKK